MARILELTPEFGEYLRDEARSCGQAGTISFPRTTDEVREVLRELARRDEQAGTFTPICVQGGRTGPAAGAVPAGGHVMNLSKMNGYLGMRACGDDRGSTRLFIRVQPGLVLSQLRSDLADKNVPCAGFSEESMRACRAFQDGPAVFFPTDPTEVSAEPDAWYDHQLVGLDVVRDDAVIGSVVRVDHLPSHDLLIVEAGEDEVMVPFVSAIVPEVDVPAGRVVVTPPAGLFEELPEEPGEPAADDASEEPSSPR